MESRLTIVNPAGDLLLAPIAALRVAAGLAADDVSRDDELTALGNRISAEIVEACGIAVAAGREPTLRKERVSETFETGGDDVLVLARRHNVSIVTVHEDGTAITLNTRALDAEGGLVERWVDGRKDCWRAKETVIVYDAGFETAPFSLAGVVTDVARMRLSEAAFDPLVKAIEVEQDNIDRVRTERWVGGFGSSSSGGFPPGIMARLARFMNYQMR